MNKQIKQAIDEDFPLHWETDPERGDLKLIATTYVYEYGSVRTRTVWRTYDFCYAHAIHGQIVNNGGRIHGLTPKEIYERQQDEA